MNTRLLHVIVGLVITFSLLDGSRSFSQGRTTGRSRDGERETKVTPVSPPRAADTPTRTGRPIQTAETPATPSPGTGSKEIRRPEPQRQAPSVVDPPPRNEGRPYHPPQLEESPQTVIVIEGGYEGVPVEPGRFHPFWIRDGVTYGGNVTLSSLTTLPEYSGYDFSELLKRPFDHLYTDMYAEEDGGELMMVVGDDSKIMDLGSVVVPPNVIYIAGQRWSTDGRVLLVPDHEYVVRTWDHHYAKFLVTSLSWDRVSFDWAYQVACDDNPVVTVRSGPWFRH